MGTTLLPPEEGEVYVKAIENTAAKSFARRAVRRGWIASRRGPRRAIVIVAAELDDARRFVSQCRTKVAEEFCFDNRAAVESIESIGPSGLIIKGRPKIIPASQVFNGQSLDRVKRLLWWLVTE